MARTASIILTPAERKAQVAQLKTDIRETAAQIKAVLANEKATAKSRAASDKSFEVQMKAILKERAAEDKAVAKELTAADKKKALLEAQLSALTNDPAFKIVKTVTDAANKNEKVVVTITGESTDKPKRTRRTKAEMEAFRAGAAA